MNLLPRLCELKPHAHCIYVQTTNLVAQLTHCEDSKQITVQKMLMAKKHFRSAITQNVTECEKNNREQAEISIGSSFDSQYTADGPTRTTNKNSIIGSAHKMVIHMGTVPTTTGNIL